MARVFGPGSLSPDAVPFKFDLPHTPTLQTGPEARGPEALSRNLNACDPSTKVSFLFVDVWSIGQKRAGYVVSGPGGSILGPGGAWGEPATDILYDLIAFHTSATKTGLDLWPDFRFPVLVPLSQSPSQCSLIYVALV